MPCLASGDWLGSVILILQNCANPISSSLYPLALFRFPRLCWDYYDCTRIVRIVWLEVNPCVNQFRRGEIPVQSWHRGAMGERTARGRPRSIYTLVLYSLAVCSRIAMWFQDCIRIARGFAIAVRIGRVALWLCKLCNAILVPSILPPFVLPGLQEIVLGL